VALNPAIRLRDVGKRYGQKWVLKDVSITINETELILIVGPNGAGKSTLLKVIAGVIKPTMGEVILFRESTKPSKPEAKRHLGVLLHESFLYDELNVRENLQFFEAMYGGSRGDWWKFVEVLDVDKVMNSRVSELSYGWRKRVDVVRALVHHPRIVLLDEVFSELDRDTCQLVTKRVIPQVLEEGTTVVMASHIVEYMEGLSYTEIRLHEGRVISVERRGGVEFQANLPALQKGLEG